VTEYASRGDPRRTMELLWGRWQPPTRGPKHGLTLEEVVSTAIAIADADGLAEVSMRKVADRLNRSPMALYTYVPGKAELLDLMLDRVLADEPTEHPREEGWRVAVEAAARAEWGFYERHPWVLQVSGSRAVLGPNELDHYEAMLRLFDGFGLTGVEVARSVNALTSFVRGCAKAVSDARAAERATGLSDDQWWLARSPLLAEMTSDVDWAERFPTATKLAAEHAFDQLDRPDDSLSYTVREAVDAFEFGLQRLLDGFEALIDRRARSIGAGRPGRAPSSG
jgi:AcrR family transcriptional regulator